MKKGLNEAVASYLVSAQLASDGGKGIRMLKWELSGYVPDSFKKRWIDGYKNKDKYVLKAINAINRAHGTSGFSFFVTEGDDKAPTLVYFNYKIDGERRQISFHSFDKELDRFKSSKGKRHWTSWDNKDRIRKDQSRRNAEELAMKVLFQPTFD